jgi:hypothetical protein
MKKITITKARTQTRVANLIVKEVNNAISFFSDPSEAKIDEAKSCGYYKVIEVKQNHGCRILTFAEIDIIRGVVDKFCKKYNGIGYYMDTAPYLAQDGETWLHQPVMCISIPRYDEDIYNK